MNEKPLLSICIPTYNRAYYLRKSLESLVSQEEFLGGLVEIVISDNASTDNTREVVQDFCSRFLNIYYYTNEENVRDKNFPIVLSKANGIYRKLCNDTMIFNKDALRYFLQCIRENLAEKPVLFWESQVNEGRELYLFGLDSVLKHISYWATSISCFGVWEEDFIYNEEGCDKCLWQVPNLFESILKKEKCVVFTRECFYQQNVEKKDLTYGIFQVFYTNFLDLTRGYLTDGAVSIRTYEQVEKRLLLDFFFGFVVSRKIGEGNFRFANDEKLENALHVAYSSKYYYRYYKFKVWYTWMKAKFKKIILNLFYSKK